jgi:ketosteroid isomerase-like protein
MRRIALAVSFALALAAFGAEAAPPPEASKAIEAVLDDWHDAAAKADEPRYFAHFTPDGVYLGTDATERWTASEFRAWAQPYFKRGKAWTFKAKKRNVVVAGDTAWFDELLDTQNMGTCRGSGAPQGEGHGRSRSTTSIPIPNDLSGGHGTHRGLRGWHASAVAPTPERPSRSRRRATKS